MSRTPKLAVWAAMALAAASVVGAEARPGDRIRYARPEYLAAYGRADAARSRGFGDGEPSCRRLIGRRDAGILTQECLDVAVGSHLRCTFERPMSCTDLIDALARFCPPVATGDVPCGGTASSETR